MIEKYYKIIACFSIILLCGGVYLYMSENDKASDSAVLLSSENEKDEIPLEQNLINKSEKKPVYIHICGEVKKPGVYKFTGEPRLVEVIKKAGGFTKKAAAESINQAQVVTDGEQIIIQNKKEIKKAKREAASENKEVGADSLVNINTAAKEELMTLTGIGEAKATMIIQYREENGAYKAKEDIMNISGIKEGVFNKIKDRIKV